MKNLEAAAVNLGKAAEFSGNPRHYYNWGLTLQNLNKPDGAEQAYQKGISVNPNFEPLKYALAILYIQQNKTALARPLVLELIQLNPNNPDYQNLLRAVQ